MQTQHQLFDAAFANFQLKSEFWCGLTSFPADERPLQAVRGPVPHGDGFGVSRIHGAPLLVVAPVLVALEEVGFADGLPAQRGVDAVPREAAAQLLQAAGVTGLGRHLPEHPVLIACRRRRRSQRCPSRHAHVCSKTPTLLLCWTSLAPMTCPNTAPACGVRMII